MHFISQAKVTSYDCDMRNRMKVSAAMRYMQETAGQNLINLGCPAEILRKEDMVFLLTKISIKVHRMPVFNEELNIGTAPTHTKGVKFAREFIIDNKEGERLISAISYWPLIQPSTRKVLRPKEFKKGLPFQPETVSKYISDISFPKVAMPDEMLYIEEIKYSEIDINNHVNNAVYADFICDALPYDLMAESDLDTFVIGFQNEAIIDDNIVIKRLALSDKKYLVTGEHSRAACFKGFVTFL